MSDMIVGVAVLDKTDAPAYLHVLCHCADGRKRHTSIPVYAKGEKKVMEHQWCYEARGEMLHVTPSLNWIGTFHNQGNWSVKFKEFTDTVHHEGSGFHYAGDLFRHLNDLQVIMGEKK